ACKKKESAEDQAGAAPYVPSEQSQEDEVLPNQEESEKDPQREESAEVQTPSDGKEQEQGGSDSIRPEAETLALCTYPKIAAFPDLNKISMDEWDEVNRNWRSEREMNGSLAEKSGDIDSFVQKTMSMFLENGNENAVYSPLNIYLALAMLAEATEGEAQTEILNLLDADSLPALRKKAKGIWESHYRADGAVGLVLASSLWLAENLDCDQATLDRLKDNYYTSVFRGKMGSESYDQALRDWLNEQTGGLLSDYVAGEKMDANTLLNMVTTVYFSAKWEQGFYDAGTAVFHGAKGDKTFGYMGSKNVNTYYWGEKFGAVDRYFKANGGRMRFILPDEGVDVHSLLTDSEALSFIFSGDSWKNSKTLMVNHAIPKFDISAKTDLMDGLKSLGVKKVFSSLNSFSPLLGEQEAYLESASHTARVQIDEEGCKAAAYTEMMKAGSAMPPDEEMDFIVDRPFVFVLYSEHGVPMFVGVVNQL
ncbi:MAG: hypothetical protein IJP27_04375, partial [Clostridia bacterium]|nr:hypothetical protein [Clostridia bacterium]